ncbi:hypothetical protein HPB51_007453 [Rhipicephalus microplus]|uniref:Transmembrane protein n=1 Tax=Rhipicephalus microplus TaxID=6941 RepID=A0A9J6EZ84_RHIMP|nr:hypothetical protein HPB51_007453 [Rhipicephalus microplus]
MLLHCSHFFDYGQLLSSLVKHEVSQLPRSVYTTSRVALSSSSSDASAHANIGVQLCTLYEANRFPAIQGSLAGTSPLPSSLAPSPPFILLNVVLACLPRNSNTALRKGTHVSSVPLSWRRSGLLLQASGRCPTSSWTRLLGVESSFEDRFDPVTPSVSSGNTRLSAASSCRSYLLQCLSVGLVPIGVFICTSSFLSASFFLLPLRPQQANPARLRQ